MISGTVGFRIAGLRFRIGLGLLWLGPGLLELKLEIGDTVRSGAANVCDGSVVSRRPGGRCPGGKCHIFPC